MRESVSGKFLINFPDLVKELDLEKHADLDINIIKAGSTKKLWWICILCNNSFEQKIQNRTANKQACPKKECQIKKRNKT